MMWIERESTAVRTYPKWDVIQLPVWDLIGISYGFIRVPCSNVWFGSRVFFKPHILKEENNSGMSNAVPEAGYDKNIQKQVSQADFG